MDPMIENQQAEAGRGRRNPSEGWPHSPPAGKPGGYPRNRFFPAGEVRPVRGSGAKSAVAGKRGRKSGATGDRGPGQAGKRGDGARADYPYLYRFDRQGRKGQRCRVTARGTLNSRRLEFEDGFVMISSGNALRRAQDRTAATCANWDDGYCHVCGVPQQGFEVDAGFRCPGWRPR